MKRKLGDNGAVRFLVEAFYQKVAVHPVLGPVFNEVAAVDWDHHLNKMTEFWSFVLLHQGSYTGNTTAVHVDLAKRTPMEPERFEAWLQLWNATLDEHFEGESAEAAKQKAQQLAWIIQSKIQGTTT